MSIFTAHRSLDFLCPETAVYRFTSAESLPFRSPGTVSVEESGSIDPSRTDLSRSPFQFLAPDSVPLALILDVSSQSKFTKIDVPFYVPLSFGLGFFLAVGVTELFSFDRLARGSPLSPPPKISPLFFSLVRFSIVLALRSLP